MEAPGPPSPLLHEVSTRSPPHPLSLLPGPKAPQALRPPSLGFSCWILLGMPPPAPAWLAHYHPSDLCLNVASLLASPPRWPLKAHSIPVCTVLSYWHRLCLQLPCLRGHVFVHFFIVSLHQNTSSVGGRNRLTAVLGTQSGPAHGVGLASIYKKEITVKVEYLPK